MARTVSGLAFKISEIRIIRALNKGLIQSIPFILVGAVCVALFNLPIAPYQDFIRGIFGGYIGALFDAISAVTLDIVALVVMITVSYSYAHDESVVKSGEVHPLVPVITTLCCYMTFFVTMQGESAVAIESPGRGGIFFALFMALIVPWVFFAFLKLRLRFKPLKLSVLDTNLLVRSAFRVIFPVAATITVFVFVDVAVMGILPLEEVSEIFNQFAVDNLANSGIFSVLLTVLMMQLMWLVGIHGGGVVFDDILHNATVYDSASLFATQDFYSTFINLGGPGALLGLLVALLIVKPGSREDHLAKVSIFPLSFNIGETFIFGVPIMFNPFYFIPFVVAPLVVATLSYGAFALGIVPPPSSHVDWTTPIFLSGFLSTKSIAGVLLQLVCLACSAAIYAPFVLGFRRSLLRHRAERIKEMQQVMSEAADDESADILLRDDMVGITAREVSAYIHGCFESGELPFNLVYQPKTDKQGRPIGAEALLRWFHPDYGEISPVVLVELCDENELTTELGRWVTAEGIKEYARWKQQGIEGLHLSINLNPRHLERDNAFVHFLADHLEHHDIESGEIELEITEHMIMRCSRANRMTLENIRSLGIELSIDDMGIGYSSLTYISDFCAKSIKIDASIVREIVTDFQQQEIVRSIVELAKQLDLQVVAEGVEEKEQVDALVSLGVECFQGFHFSKPLSPDDFVEYVKLYHFTE